MKRLEEMVKDLPPDLRREVEDFVLFLLQRHRPTEGRPVRQSWAGALKEYRDRFTSLELQKKSLEWRGD